MPDFSSMISSSEFLSKLYAAGLTATTTLIFKYLQPAPKIVWGISHGFTFTVPQKDGNGSSLIHTGSVFVQNVGSAPANNIEVYLNFRPEQFQIWPTFDYEKHEVAEGHFVVRVKNLGKRESFTLEMISIPPLPDTLRVRSDRGEARRIALRTIENVPQWKLKVVVVLILLGIFAIFQNLIELFRP